MDWAHAQQKFAFAAEALDGTGGFAPAVQWESQQLPDGATRTVPARAARSHLVTYPRESPAKYAGRSALAVYENHLREDCERFVGFLMRRRPMRAGADSPLHELFVTDADRRGNSLDACWQQFSLQAKARGSMLLLVDLPRQIGRTLADQLAARAVPYLRSIAPESVVRFEIDDATGQFQQITVGVTEVWGGKRQPLQRHWDAETWALLRGDEVLVQGPHPFGACPVLAFTEDLSTFPAVGRYTQIAELSRDLFNQVSELREIQRSQTFSLLAMQAPPQNVPFDAGAAAASIGTHSMLVYPGERPGYISPDAGPSTVYMASIERTERAISRIALRESTADAGSAVESGLARRLRFEAMNAELARFAHAMEQLERRMWALFARAMGTSDSVRVSWPTDFNLADVMAELDILAGMQAGGFPPQALAAKREAIAAVEFDNSPEDTKASVIGAIREQAQEAANAADPAQPPAGNAG